MTITTTQTDQFIREGLFLRNWSQRTASIYRAALVTLHATPLTKAELNAWVVRLRERGLTPGGVNVHVRSVNSFLTWMHGEGHLSERLKVKTLKNPPKTIDLMSDGDVKRLLSDRPTSFVQRRAWTLAVVLLDTGVRINEVLGLERKKVNLDALTLTVLGKGSRERIVPMSLEGRKHLFRWLQTQPDSSRYVFGTANGARLAYRNIYRDLTAMCRRVGIAAAVNPHAFRHAFAVNYIRAGGDVYRLSRILGHSNIGTTQIYLRSMGVEHLREGHHSPLMRA